MSTLFCKFCNTEVSGSSPNRRILVDGQTQHTLCGGIMRDVVHTADIRAATEELIPWMVNPGPPTPLPIPPTTTLYPRWSIPLNPLSPIPPPPAPPPPTHRVSAIICTLCGLNYHLTYDSQVCIAFPMMFPHCPSCLAPGGLPHTAMCTTRATELAIATIGGPTFP
jgi:hypothetical protein